jgi:hypothetical protein
MYINLADGRVFCFYQKEIDVWLLCGKKTENHSTSQAELERSGKQTVK